MNRRVLGFGLAALGAALIVFQVCAYISPRDPASPESAATAAKTEAVNSGARRVVGERIVRLPEDGSKFHVTVFTADGWQYRPQDRALLSSFDTVPELQSLKSQTFFHHYQPSNRLFGRYRSSLTELPAVVVQQGDGTVVYKASGAKIPDDSWRLVDDIREALHERFPNVCPGPNCPEPQPYHDPTLRPAAAPLNPVPDIGQKQSDDVVVVGAIVGVMCLIGGVAIAWRKQHG